MSFIGLFTQQHTAEVLATLLGVKNEIYKIKNETFKML